MDYLMGKIQGEQILSDQAKQLRERLGLRQFHDEFLQAGMIPIAFIPRGMTGLEDQTN